MTAKQYLRQIRDLDQRVSNMLSYYERCTLDIASLKSPRLDADRVQTSGSGAGFTAAVEKLVDLQARSNRIIDEFTDLRDRIVKEINTLQYPYSAILYKRYVEYKDFMTIAEELVYSYDRILTLHGMALQTFASRYLFQ